MKNIVIFLFIALFCIASAQAADVPAELEKRLAAAGDKAERADILKQIGDYHISVNQYEKAAQAYLQALPELRNRLTEDEWTRIAVYLSWVGKFGESAAELRALLVRYPGNTKARGYLAKVLLWSGKQDEALAEAETILKSRADDRDALFVQAEALRIKGNGGLDRSIVIYQSLLVKGEDFDTRLGLARAYFQKGNLEQAKTEAARLKPASSNQKQEVDRLAADIEKGRVAREAEIAAERAQIAAVGVEANRLKTAGDQSAAANQYEPAAASYEKALALSRAFSAPDRLRMAQVLSWTGRLALSRELLEELVAKEPANLAPRLHLAKVLTWSGEHDLAIREADAVLAVDSGNRDARLTKANALRYRGFYRKADTYYTSLLKEGEDFDVRTGYTYGLLAQGRRIETDESMALLKPQQTYQEREFATLKRDRNWAFRPRLYAGAMFYYDNDDNRVVTYSAGGQAYLGNWRTNLDYAHSRALSDTAAANGDAVLLSTYSRMPWYGGIGGGVGLSNGSFFTWNLRADWDVLYGSAGVSAANEAFNSTAELIEKNIRSLAFSGWTVQRPTDRITLAGSYTYRDYSDHNGSHSAVASISYQFWRKPAMSVGYRFNYMDFRRQSLGGYFDPDDFLSHALFFEFGFDARPFYGYVSPYVGYQDYSRYGEHQSGTFYGAGGLLGYWINDRAAFEAFGEWGNSLSGATMGAGSGWYYYIVGARVIVSF